MKTKIEYSICLLALAVLSVSCGKEMDLSEDDFLYINPSGTTGMTITAITCDSEIREETGRCFEVVWSAGDIIVVDGAEFTLIEGAGTTTGKFEGPLLPDGSYEAYYGISGKKLPALQHYYGTVITGVPMYSEVTVVDGSPLPAYFTNLCGLLRLKVGNNESVRMRQLAMYASQPMAGDFKIASSGAAVLTDDSTVSLMLDCGEGGLELSPEGTYFYLALPEGRYRGISLILTGADGKYCEKRLGVREYFDIARATVCDYEWQKTDFIERESVDLGLSVRWATRNVGAYSSEDYYGGHYAWGETVGLYEGKTDFNWCNYKWCANDDKESITRYSYSVDGVTILYPEDDAASVNWRGAWRMPTYDEFSDLIYNCYWLWTADYDGTGAMGYIVYKAKKEEDKRKYVYEGGTPLDGYSLSDVHIFLPVEDVVSYNPYSELTCAYWAGEKPEYLFGKEFLSYVLLLQKTKVTMLFDSRELGMLVRAVCPKDQ